MPDLEAIRERNEERKRAVADEEYSEHAVGVGPGQWGGGPGSWEDIDALLAEVERLRAIACRHGRPMLAPCEFCERDEPVDTTAGVDVDRPAY